MTAALATAARVPVQAGPPAIERTDDGARSRWDLMDAAKAGDRRAFGQLYALYEGSVFRFAYRRCSNRHLAEDITADTFVRALRSIGSVSWQGRDPGAWLFTIARNLVADHFKSGRYRLETTVGDILEGGDRIDHDPEGDPERAVVDHLTNVTLITALQQLGAEQRQCITLRFLQGLTVAETAQAMGKNEGAIKALQYRATRTLARLLPAGFEADRC